jgi:Xaa-Pro aminopeptidase
MFQNFEVLSSPDQAADRVARLRVCFSDWGVNAVAVPRSDEYLGEYVPACAERLAWLTGYTGSAGSVLVLEDKAHIFVDGRYTNQVRAQTDPSVFDYQDGVATPLAAFVEATDRRGLRLGIDPWTWPTSEVLRLENGLKPLDGQLVFLPRNPVDAIWDDRPQPPLGAVSLQPLELAGVPAGEKLAMMAQAAAKAGADALVLADPSSVAWSFNIRGEDLPSTPHPLSRAIITASGRPLLFIDKRKTGIEAEAYLTQLADLEPPSGFDDALVALGKGRRAPSWWIPPSPPHAILNADREQSGGTVLMRHRSRPPAPRSARTRRRSPPAHPCIARMAPRWCAFSPGSMPRSPAASTRSAAGTRSSSNARRDDRRSHADAAPGAVLRHDLRRRPECRHHPLPGQHANQPPHSIQAKCC